MKRFISRIFRLNIIFPLLVFLTPNIFSQSIRSLVNEGVELYHQKKYGKAEVNFKKGIEEKPQNFKAAFNLADTYYKQERYDEAVKSFKGALTKTEDKNLKAQIFHNLGNSLLKSNKIKESIEAYKEALKVKPNDAETKYNLSYALKLLKEKNQKQGQKKNSSQKDNKEKKSPDKSDSSKKEQNKDKQNKKENKESDQQDQKQSPGKKQNDKRSAEKLKISKEQAERILNALRNNEAELQKKIRKMKPKEKIKTDKDW